MSALSDFLSAPKQEILQSAWISHREQSDGVMLGPKWTASHAIYTSGICRIQPLAMFNATGQDPSATSG